MRRAGRPSAVGAALRLAARGIREGLGRSDAEPNGVGPAAPRRRLAIERTCIPTDPASVRAYLRGIGAGDEASGIGAGAPLPPIYPALWEVPLAIELLLASDLPAPRAGLVHLGGETVRVRPAAVDQPVDCRAELAAVEPASTGLRLTLEFRNRDRSGRLYSEDTLVLLARMGASGARRGERPAASVAQAGPQPQPQPEREWEILDEWVLGAGDGRRYARASGDYNPIHLWPWTARPFGFKRPILQGFCTQARVAQALIAGALGGSPEALRRMDISFRSPVELPGRARLLVSREGAGGRFRVVCEGAPKPAAEGSWVGQG